MNKRSTKIVYLLGDSITQGLGSKKVNFSGELQRLLGDSYDVVNLAYTGTMVDYALKLVEDGEVAPLNGESSVVVILYGNVDAQIRPNRGGRVFPHIPKRYQGSGMLMPRPFYSASVVKKAGQHFDNFQRSVYSRIIKLVDGVEQWNPLNSFSVQYSMLLNKLTEIGTTPICCSCVFIDEKLFPGSPVQYARYSHAIAELAGEHGLNYIDMCSVLKSEVEAYGWDSCYNKDHFHPNGAGYKIMAEMLFDAISRQ